MDTGMEGQITAEMDTCWRVAASMMDGCMCGYKTQMTRMDTWTNGWRVQVQARKDALVCEWVGTC